MIILPQERGLLYRKGVYQRLLMPGSHFIFPGYTVVKYQVTESFIPDLTPLEILLSDAELAAQLEVKEIHDGHILLVMEDGNIKAVRSAGKAAYWKGVVKREFISADLSKPEEAADIPRAVLTSPVLKPFVQTLEVSAGHKGVLFIDSVFSRILESGIWYFWRGPLNIDCTTADLRLHKFEITGQEILTRDKVPLRLNFFCEYRVTDVMKAALEIADLNNQFHILLQLALRAYIGTLGFDELLEKKDAVGKIITDAVKEKAAGYGLETGDAGIKDIILPGEIRDIMNQVLIAEKKAQANVITRREETASTRSLLNTAKLMEDNEILMRLKEFEYIERISEKVSQITLAGGGQLMEQLRGLFVPRKPEA